MIKEQSLSPIEPTTAREFWHSASLFVLIGVLLYSVLVAVAEVRVRTTGERNPFFQIATMINGEAKLVVMGASHAMPLGFTGAIDALESATDFSVANLAIEGGGVLPNALMLDALLRKTRPAVILYSLDSFAFLSPKWNEERLTDSDLLAFAPFDTDVLTSLLWEPAALSLVPIYLSGFEKVNRLFSNAVDRSEAELVKFDRTYRTNDRIDDQRMAFLFPDASEALLASYLVRFEKMVIAAQTAGSNFVILLMPVPPRYVDRLPAVQQSVMSGVADIAARYELQIIDHTTLLPGEENYYDTDHLNRTGTMEYINGALAEALRKLH